MIDKRTWEEFRDFGFLWWINMILHTFGWAITLEPNGDEGFVAYPARVKFRGFSEKLNTEGYAKVSKYVEENASELLKESKE